MNGPRFISGHSLGESSSVFSGALDLVNICRSDHEVDAGIFQEFLSAGRS
jgi:hypothetical protein